MTKTPAPLEPLLRVDERLSRLGWPVLATVKDPQIGSGAILVMCSGFEDRATAFLERALACGNHGFRVIVVDYRPTYAENRRLAVEALCHDAGLETRWITYDREAPAGAGETIVDQMRGMTSGFIDISGMSRLLITQIIVALGQRDHGLRGVSIVYAEAEYYPPSREQFETDYARGQDTGQEILSYISSGVYDLAVTPELSSDAMVGQPIRMIAFPSFNREQFVVLLDVLQPAFVELVDGIPPREEYAWRPDAIRRCNERAIRGLSQVAWHKSSTLDYRSTLRLLLALYDRYGVFDKLVVAPTGSKMQSVAVGIARTYLRDLQVVYPTPLEFTEPQRHTVGVRRLSRLKLDIFARLNPRDA